MAESSVSVKNRRQPRPRRGTGSNQFRKRPQGRSGEGGAKPKTAASTSSAPNAPASSSSTPNDEFDSSSKDTENPAAQTRTDDLQQPPDDASQEQDLCWICAEPIKYYAVSECNHRTCHVCALRLRALYKKLDCTFCKVRICVPPLPRLSCSLRGTDLLTDARVQGTTTYSRLHALPRCPLLVLYSGEHPAQRRKVGDFVRDAGDDAGIAVPPTLQLSRSFLRSHGDRLERPQTACPWYP